MRVIVHTPLGTFQGSEILQEGASREQIDALLKKLCVSDRFSLEIETGETIYMTKGIIDQSVFVLEP
jgi:hypothetical protein